MTLDQAKNEIARKHGYKEWKTLKANSNNWAGNGMEGINFYWKEVAELLAEQAWKEGCIEGRKYSDANFCLNTKLAPKLEREISHLILTAPIPEYKP